MGQFGDRPLCALLPWFPAVHYWRMWGARTFTRLRLRYNGLCAPVAQLDRANASEALGREFESRRAHHLLSSPTKSAPAACSAGPPGVFLDGIQCSVTRAARAIIAHTLP